MPTRLLLLLTLAAALVAGCGGAVEARPASSTTDAHELLHDTFGSLDQIKSASLDANLAIVGGGQTTSAHLAGPFESQGAGRLPKFQLDATLESRGRSFKLGATWTGEKGYVSVEGTPYELSGLVARELEAGYEQASKAGKGGGILSSLGIDPTNWIKDPRNEGDAQAGGVPTIKLTGRADVPRILDDLQALSGTARALNLPGSRQAPQELTAQQRQQIVDTVERVAIEVYTGKEDRLLRRIVVSADLKTAGTQDISHVAFDLTLDNVGADQQITAPKDARPFSELQGGLGLIGGSGRSSGATTVPFVGG